MMNNTRPSFYLISSAVDGNVNAIEKILALYDPYISKCCLRPFYDKSSNSRLLMAKDKSQPKSQVKQSP